MNIMDYAVKINDEPSKANSKRMDDTEDDIPQPVKNYGMCGFLTVAYYQPYFNVTQEDVLKRTLSAMTPIKQDFLQIVQNNPDLWGPVWISTTLILLIAAAGNLMSQLSVYLNSSTGTDISVPYNFEYVPMAAGLLYIVTFGTPMLLAVMMKCFGSEISLFTTICLYGYSMVVLVPITLLCAFPYWIIQWLAIIYGFSSSCFFLIMNLQEELSKIEQQKKYMVVGVIVGMQFLLYLMFKLFFFQIIQENKQ